ncbi:MAG TPA: hypothetical protein VJ910_06940, partial [Desulfuromonadales bacterium]|nr:hypothetical protein [Desulfuromonadales bacterium]
DGGRQESFQVDGALWGVVEITWTQHDQSPLVLKAVDAPAEGDRFVHGEGVPGARIVWTKRILTQRRKDAEQVKRGIFQATFASKSDFLWNCL